jgi:hypothetical protein
MGNGTGPASQAVVLARVMRRSMSYVHALIAAGRMLHVRRQPAAYICASADHHPAAPTQCLEILRGHGGPVRTLVHANGMLFSGSYDKTVRVWDTETLECRATLTGHSGAVRALVSSPQYVFSGSDDTTIKVSRGSPVCARA